MCISKITWFVLPLVLFCVGSLTANGELVGYWSFDKADRAADLSGNGNDGIIHGSPKVIEGKVGEALEFNGNGDYVEIPDAEGLSKLDALSMSAWIQPTKLGAWSAVAEKGIHLNWSYGFFIEPDGTLSLVISRLRLGSGTTFLAPTTVNQ